MSREEDVNTAMEDEEIFDEGAEPEEAAEGAEEEGVDEFGVEESAAGGDEIGNTSLSSGADINTSSFDVLALDQRWIDDAQGAWRTFINSATSREAAGEAIYAALFDSAPSLQSLFTTPRAVQAMRFMNGLNSFVTALSDPPALKILVETLGFGHLALDVTVPRVVIFRDAILDLFQVELGTKLSSAGLSGWKALLNYVGGAIIYIKATYAERLRILDESWQIANDKKANMDKFSSSRELGGAEADKHNAAENEEAEGKKNSNTMGQKVPTTYNEMFQFNAAVMGYGNSVWMQEILACFDNIVKNVANSNRLAEECDVLVLRISKVAAKVNLAEYKSCMLASLRSLLPKDWSTNHEVAWCWLWENVERMLYTNMGKPPVWEKALGKFLGALDESQAFEFRAAVYARFFALCPPGQDYFKQSNTYLHLVATKIMVMTIDMYKDPVRMTDDISALGLRHVGYGIPTEYFGPFATACIEVLNSVSKDDTLIESFRWSLGLIAKSLVRTILEGSTIVMKAVNANTAKSMAKAISCAPRGERVNWMLMVQVGTQNISPLAWAVEAGALESARTMITDLLTVRADRDRYYYGAEELFVRHPDIVKMLVDNAPGLLPVLFDGIIWRSRLTFNGMRRVNYYIKYLVLDPEGKFHQTLEWMVKFKDPHIVCHPALVFVADLVWSRVACRQFIWRKSWFALTLVLFVLSQSILRHTKSTLNEDGYKVTPEGERILVFIVRVFIYCFGLGSMLYSHVARSVRAIKKGDLAKVAGRISVPSYLVYWQDALNLVLVFFLLVMLATEPVLHCMTEAGTELFVEDCASVKTTKVFPYSFVCMVAMFLYFVLLIDLAVFSNAVTAYVLVCGRMLSELGLFLFLGLGALLMFSSSLSCLHQTIEVFHGIPSGMVALFEVFMGMFSASEFEEFHAEYLIVVGLWVFIVGIILFLGNMLIAQLSCAYGTIYNDMVGYARLKRIGIITESMPMVSPKRWERFVASNKFDTNIEFNEGDVGVAGGIASTEPAAAHPTTQDSIKRFGGSTSPSLQWPDSEEGDEEADKMIRLEKMLQTLTARIEKTVGGAGKKRRGKTGSSTGPTTSSGAEESFGDVVEEEEA